MALALRITLSEEGPCEAVDTEITVSSGNPLRLVLLHRACIACATVLGPLCCYIAFARKLGRPHTYNLDRTGWFYYLHIYMGIEIWRL
jgi:hypothetical protein